MENYFELYGLPVKFEYDAADVRKKFLGISRTYHPDHFATSDEKDQKEALSRSAMNNEAFKILSDPDRRMGYILKLTGILEDEEKYALPPAFLMEMMDLNEVISEYEMAPDGSNKQEAFSALEREFSAWHQAIYPLLGKFDNGDSSAALLAQIKDYYFRKKYLLRIQERLDTFAI